MQELGWDAQHPGTQHKSYPYPLRPCPKTMLQPSGIHTPKKSIFFLLHPREICPKIKSGALKASIYLSFFFFFYPKQHNPPGPARGGLPSCCCPSRWHQGTRKGSRP